MIVRLGHYGGPRGIYGSFVGKSQLVGVTKQGGRKKKKWEPIQFQYEEKPPKPTLPEFFDIQPGLYGPPIARAEPVSPSTATVHGIVDRRIASPILSTVPGLVAKYGVPELKRPVKPVQNDEEQLLLLLIAA